MKIKTVILLLAAFAAPRVFAAGRAPVDFDDFDGGMTGARALGMGNAVVAVKNMPEASYWNPAGLNFLDYNMFTVCLDLMRSSRLQTHEIIQTENLRGRKLTYLALAGANGGLAYRPLVNKYVEDITDPLDPENNKTTKEIKVNSFTLSLAQGPHDKNEAASIGMNLSYLNGTIAVTEVKDGQKPYANIADGNGFSIDWGTMIRLKDNLTLGFMAHNIPGFIYWEDYNKTQLPVCLRAGFSMNLPGLMTIGTEYEKRYYRDTNYRPKFVHMGAEQQLGEWLVVRGGVYGEDLNDSSKINYTAGVGVVSGRYMFDVAFRKFKKMDETTIQEYDDIYQYVVSITMPFGDKKRK